MIPCAMIPWSVFAERAIPSRCLGVVVPWLFAAAACGGGSADPIDASTARDTTISDGLPPTSARMRVHYPTTPEQSLTLRGDGPGLTWEVGHACAPAGDRIWECTVEGVSEPFEAKPLIDDATWARGTNWRLAPGATLEVYPSFLATNGRLVTHAAVRSSFLDADRDVVVYLPPSYDESPTKRYPIVIMHDGQNLFDPSQAFGGVAWEIDAAIDGLVGAAGIVEAIVVGVSNTRDRMFEYTPTRDPELGEGGGAPRYVRFLIEELKPFVDATYRTDGGPAGLAGSSLGGLVTLYACWTRPESFGRCGVFSPSLWWDSNNLQAVISADPATAATKPVTIYLDSGGAGPSMDGMTDTAAMRDVLVSKGFTPGERFRYVLAPTHAHDETAWAARAPEALRWLLADPDRVP